MSWQMSNVKVCTRYRRLEHNESCFGEAGLRSFKMNRVCRNVIVMKQFMVDTYSYDSFYVHIFIFVAFGYPKLFMCNSSRHGFGRCFSTSYLMIVSFREEAEGRFTVLTKE